MDEVWVYLVGLFLMSVVFGLYVQSVAAKHRSKSDD